MNSIATVTVNPAYDKSAQLENVLPEHKLRCHSLRAEPGGGGINVSRAIKKLGGISTTLYVVGGPTGQALRRLLEEEALNHRPLPIAQPIRESLVVFEESSGQQYRFSLPGPTLTDEEWRACFEAVADLDPPPAYLVASGSLPPGVPPDFYARLAELAQARGSRFVLDTSSAKAMKLALEAGVYLIKPNLREFRQLTGRSLETETEQEEAVQEIIRGGQSEVVVVSLGAAGALLGSAAGNERLRAPTVTIRSKVGAGDSTVAGLVLSLARGNPLLDSVRFGIAAGAAAVMTEGTELCRLKDTIRLYEDISGGI